MVEKSILVNGNAQFDTKEGSFKGIFKGNNFALAIPFKGHMLTIVGKISFNEDDSTFKELWIGRGFPIKWWITRSFILLD